MGSRTNSAVPCPHQARVGQRLRGKWLLERLLGVGGTAAVYAAVHRNGMRGAVKILHAELKQNHESRGRFLYEGVVANRVSHEGIVAVLDDDVMEDDTPFLVMELLEGEAVDERMERSRTGRLGVADACRIIHRLLDVLAAAHRAGVIHRDVKPENVFVTTEGRIKLLDFGVAHVDECPLKVVMTRFGYTLGTPAFMPPEQATGDWANMGPATDLWAVGASMFNMLTGTLVHGEAALYKLLQRTATEPAPAIRNKRPDLPEALAAVVDRALAFEIPDRFQSAREMRDALEAAYPACKDEVRRPRTGQGRSDASRPRLLLTSSAMKTTSAPARKHPMTRASGALATAVFVAGLLASASSLPPDGLGADASRRNDGDSQAFDLERALESAGGDDTMTPTSDSVAGFVEQGPPAPFDARFRFDEPGASIVEASRASEPSAAARAKARKPTAVERAFRTRL